MHNFQDMHVYARLMHILPGQLSYVLFEHLRERKRDR